MAVYDLEEQEKIDDLKAWWNQWGNLIAGIAVAVALGIFAVQAWRWWQGHQAEQASVLYSAVSAAVKANDVPKAKEALAQLEEKFGGTGYAPRGALLVAKLLYDSGDVAGATAQLNFVLDKSAEDELKQIARVRLASIQFDQKQYDDALRTLDAKHDEPFAGVYEDLRGDILAAAGRTNEARTAYQTALTKLDSKGGYYGFVQAKLDAIGGPLASTPGSVMPNLPVQPNAPAGSAAPAQAPAPAATPAPAAPTK
jgi:predicted negative regulator of RcsB-dependent stress response